MLQYTATDKRTGMRNAQEVPRRGVEMSRSGESMLSSVIRTRVNVCLKSSSEFETPFFKQSITQSFVNIIYEDTGLAIIDELKKTKHFVYTVSKHTNKPTLRDI